jgi:hypothetical protein
VKAPKREDIVDDVILKMIEYTIHTVPNIKKSDIRFILNPMLPKGIKQNSLPIRA